MRELELILLYTYTKYILNKKDWYTSTRIGTVVYLH